MKLMELNFNNLLYNNDCLEKPKGYSDQSKKNFYPGSEDLEKWFEERQLDGKYEVRYYSKGDKGNISFSKITTKPDYIIAILKTENEEKEKKFEVRIIPFDELINIRPVAIERSWSLDTDIWADCGKKLDSKAIAIEGNIGDVDKINEQIKKNIKNIENID